MPISSFDPRYGALILRGARERVEIRQTSRKDAKRLSNLLTTFRARLKREYAREPARWEPYYGAIIGVSEDGYSTVIRPRSLEAEHLLQDIRIGGEQLQGIEGEASVPDDVTPLLPYDPLAEFDEGVPLTIDEGEK
jgi:hypothetical protein